MNRVAIAAFIGANIKIAISVARMNDPVWVAGLDRARATQKYQFEAIHVVAPLRNEDGVAPVVLQTSTEYLRSPPYMEAAFELCLRHLHKVDAPRPKDRNLTAQALLADRAKAALKLPGRYIPTAEGFVIDAAPQSSCEAPELVLTPQCAVAEAVDPPEAAEAAEPPEALAPTAEKPLEALASSVEPQLPPEVLARSAEPPPLPGRAAEHEPLLSKKARRRAVRKKIRKRR